MARLAGKIALVTGASRGIGRAIAIALAHEGAAVAVNYRVSTAEAERVVEELSALDVKTMLVQANVSNGAETRDMVQRVFKAWGRIDVMVNSAGITRDKSLRKMTDEDWLDVITTNLNSV
jgi:NAD(P)-dependent dehydrogenase (short-subunit alcohol dehydrogenase family)